MNKFNVIAKIIELALLAGILFFTIAHFGLYAKVSGFTP